ncbi:MAG: IS3 family transposase [Coriobacteriales bacterium]|nr:IS3 family transposase [Coriobacteriales bacterium]
MSVFMTSAVGDAAKRAKFAFVLPREHEYEVAEMCRVPGAGGQGHCQWKSRAPSAHAVRDAELASEISRVWESSRRTYGSPRVFMQLRRDDVSTSEKRVARIMRERGWAGVPGRCAKSPDGGEMRAGRKDGAPDLFKRHFDADGPDQAWFADITYVRTYRGWLYLAIVTGIWSRRAPASSRRRSPTNRSPPDFHLSEKPGEIQVQFCWAEQVRGSDASATESLRAHVANGTHRVTRAMLTDEPQPFWEYWEGRLPEVTEDDLWGPEAMSILV